MEGDMQDKLAQPQLEDTQIVHAAPGEMVVPPVISNTTQQLINRDMQAVGLNPQEYVVGNGQINQLTGLQQFGFLSKVFKKIKNVVKKVAPVAVSFIPGVGPIAKGLLTAAAGKASGMDTKSALLGGLTAGIGSKFLGSGIGSKVADKGIFGGTIGPRIKSGLGSFFKPGDQATGIFGGQIGPNLRRGIGNLFSPQDFFAPQQQIDPNTGGFVQTSYGAPNYQLSQEEMKYITENFTPMGESGLFKGPDGKGYTPDQIVAGLRASQPQTQQRGLGFNLFGGTPGQSRLGIIEDILKGRGSDPVRSGGSFFGIDTPGPIKGIEDVIKGQQTGDSRGGLAALAALYGLATKRAAEDRVGGLTDIRASRRPDLAAQPVFQGFDLGVRPGMAYGGTAEGRPGFAKGGPLNPEVFELDYRQVGGPTIGIGTGTSDDIPAMLSDGEYVFTTSANNGAGAFDISKSKDSIMLKPDGKPNREKGAKNLGMLMDMFEDTDKRLS